MYIFCNAFHRTSVYHVTHVIECKTIVSENQNDIAKQNMVIRCAIILIALSIQCYCESRMHVSAEG